jgi:hypothetical protein
VLGDSQVEEATRSEAARITVESLRPAPTERDAQEALGALACNRTAATWARVAVALTGVGRIDVLLEAVGRSERMVGPWRLLVAERRMPLWGTSSTSSPWGAS